jgi:glycosyltransferase involved in cell wall biosynthesis
MMLHIIAPALPPALDGIGDYTAALSAELAQSCRVKILYPFGRDPIESEPDRVIGVTMAPVFCVSRRRSVLRIADTVANDRPDWLILQFNQFSYGKWGLNPFLPLTLGKIRKRVPGTRIAVMFHEDFVPPINWKFAIMRVWQKWQFKQLGRLAHVVMFSIDPWARKYRDWFPNKPVLHLPVGSNLTRIDITREDARQRLEIPRGKIVLGIFGAVNRTRNLPWLSAAIGTLRRSKLDTMILYIGADGAVVRELAAGIPVIAEGPLPADEVSRRLSAVDVFLAPFEDGVSTRRGTLMAALQHGLAIVGTKVPLTDDLLACEDGRSFLLADSRSIEAYSQCVRSLLADSSLRLRLGQNANALFDRHFTWSSISGRLLKALGEYDRAKERAATSRVAAVG